MLVLGILSKKKYRKKDNGDLALDLTRGSIDAGAFARINPIAIHIVADDDRMRPDRIAHRAYGDHFNVDVLLKYNAISNPFALDTGDILKIPAKSDMSQIIAFPEEITDIGNVNNVDVSEKLLQPKTVKDKNRMEALSKEREILPSNINKKGDKNVKIKDGKIVFGEDVTSVNKDNCPEPLSRARLKRSLTKNKLFG